MKRIRLVSVREKESMTKMFSEWEIKWQREIKRIRKLISKNGF